MHITPFNPCLPATIAPSSFALAYLAILAVFNLRNGVKDLAFALFLVPVFWDKLCLGNFVEAPQTAVGLIPVIFCT